MHYRDVDEYPLAIAQPYMGGEPRGNGFRSTNISRLR